MSGRGTERRQPADRTAAARMPSRGTGGGRRVFDDDDDDDDGWTPSISSFAHAVTYGDGTVAAAADAAG